MATSSAPLSFIPEMFPPCGTPRPGQHGPELPDLRQQSATTTLLFIPEDMIPKDVIPKDRFPKMDREQARGGGLGLKTIQDSVVFAVPAWVLPERHSADLPLPWRPVLTEGTKAR